ncbi:aminoglycoside 6'-N-acetyltransferase [Thermomonospora umbrina]|uniref:Lysine N-acyltransferase MbtK n=2 Tax=Thermomonospora umbrina TaxID=111806 RepID=A0A3D9SFU0_9ACTN|nr:aminoglycoside 6'-N-acetyltransferase [Thermomonospora umbrina]
MITWRRVHERDFPLLGQWLAQPHVARWWNQEHSIEAVTRDFGPSAAGLDPTEDHLALLDGRPFGLVQRLRLADEPRYVAELSAVTDVPPGAMSIDYLIGDLRHVGRGLGPRMIESMLHKIWDEHPQATCVLVPVVAANRPSWRALEKAGFTRVAEGDLEPDNPIDDRLHYIQRIDRPVHGVRRPTATA